MAKTDKDNKYIKKHSFTTKCPEKNCNYCKPEINRSSIKIKKINEGIREE